jgi:hypothetical protein
MEARLETRSQTPMKSFTSPRPPILSARNPSSLSRFPSRFQSGGMLLSKSHRTIRAANNGFHPPKVGLIIFFCKALAANSAEKKNHEIPRIFACPTQLRNLILFVNQPRFRHRTGPVANSPMREARELAKFLTDGICNISGASGSMVPTGRSCSA